MSVKKPVARHRSFTAPTKKGDEKVLEPVTFDIDGVEFIAKAEIQGFVLLEFLEASEGGGVTSLVAFKNFLKESFEEDEYSKLEDHLKNSERKIELEEIAGIVGFLVEEFTSRPTTASAQ